MARITPIDVIKGISGKYGNGIIDSSVLTAVGELLMFGVMAQVPGILQAVRDGERIKLSKGDFSAEVSRTSYPSTDSGQALNDNDTRSSS